MFISKYIISIIKELKKRGYLGIFKKTKKVLKKGGLNKLSINVKNHFPFEQKVSSFNKKQGYILAHESRYLYLKVHCSIPCKIDLHWHLGLQKYSTKAFDLYKSPAIYLFDLYTLRASDQTGKTNYFWEGHVDNFEVISNTHCTIEWAKFTNTKLKFEEERTPLIEIIDYPDTVHLEVTRDCNIRCYMCRENRDEEVREIGTNNLDCQILVKMIPFMQNIPTIGFFGWGEPLCHPNFDRFITSIGRIKERSRPELVNKVKPHINITTNATLLTEELIHLFIKNELDVLDISIDSPSEDNFNFIRKGANFNKVVANLRMLQKIKSDYGVQYPYITILFVAMRRNIEELPAMIRFAVDLGVKNLKVEFIKVVTKGLQHESLYYHQDLANHKLDQIQKIAQLNGINISLPPRFGTKVEPQGYCDDVLGMFYVKAEGTVIPCCVATDVIIGNLYEESAEEIWQGERRKNIIDKLKKGILEGKCKGCHKFTGNDINSRETHIKV